jgi:nitroimidazol reductase NimA-like FMN-containing flavoprotein (pyridoxamine 5'-phosphate oxidase superfamily)
MEHKIRRADRAISENEAKVILQQGEYGVLSTASADGQPYGLPLNYCYVNDALYFHCAAEGHKIENIKTNNKVSFTVVGKTQVLADKFTSKYDSAIVFGKAAEITGAEKQKALIEVLKKYSSDHMESGMKMIESYENKVRVYKIPIEALTGKASR